MKKLLQTVLPALLLTGACLVAVPAQADTILKFGLSETGPDIVYSGGEFGTANDGDASTVGEQTTGLNFVGFLAGVFPDIMTGASATLEGVDAVGDAAEINGVILEQTNGGTFSLWDQNNVLLLQAELGEGSINGSTNQSTGSFFNTEVVNFTGGSLLQYVLATPGGLSFALAGITTNGANGLDVNNGALANFTANASGLVTGQPIPEPSSVALLLSSLVGLGIRRRKAAASK